MKTSPTQCMVFGMACLPNGCRGDAEYVPKHAGIVVHDAHGGTHVRDLLGQGLIRAQFAVCQATCKLCDPDGLLELPPERVDISARQP
jgi:hypothetical protein